MAFYKALKNVELKKYSEATAEDFGVVFYSKGTLFLMNLQFSSIFWYFVTNIVLNYCSHIVRKKMF